MKKIKMKKRSSRCNSDNVDKDNVAKDFNEDISLLQRPLQTAFSGFHEARRAFEGGTDEIRRLLLEECSLIYECKVCRNMFRSLINFLSHKRIYCSNPAAGYYNGYTHQNSTVIVQQQQQEEQNILQPFGTEELMRNQNTGASTFSNGNCSSERSKINNVESKRNTVGNNLRDISRVIERLRREKAPEADVSKMKENDNTTVLQLESVPTSKLAVYQTVKHQENDSIKTEVQEVHEMLNGDETVLGPDGKPIEKSLLPAEASTTNINSNEANGQSSKSKIACKLCDLEFQTEKTLNVHNKKKHSLSTFVFQCPACSLTFLQPSAVTKHLTKDHKKPMRRIRLMRESILRRRIQQGDVQPKGPNRELKRLQMSEDSPETSLAIAGQSKVMSICMYCEQSFERRAAMSTHMLNCRAKQKALQQPAPSVKRTKSNKPETCTSKTNVNIENEVASEAPTASIVTAVKVEKAAVATTTSMAISEQATTSKTNFDSINVKSEERLFSTPNYDADKEATKAALRKIFTELDAEDCSNYRSIDTIKLDTMELTSESDEQNSNSSSDSLSEVTFPDHNELNTFVDEPSQHVNELQTVDNKADDNEDNNDFNYNDKANDAQDQKADPSKKKRKAPMERQIKCRCKICNKQFNALGNLRRHISMFHHRSSRFGCKICDYRAFRRYDITNHLSFLHKITTNSPEEAAAYIATFKCDYSKEDVNDDIILVNMAEQNESDDFKPNSETSAHDSEQQLDTKPIKTYEKRSKRKKNQSDESNVDSVTTATDLIENQVSPSTKRSKKRQRSEQPATEDEYGKDAEKRPTRKRVKPENKDFVYDLTRFLKTDGAPNDTTKLPPPSPSLPVQQPQLPPPPLPPPAPEPIVRAKRRCTTINETKNQLLKAQSVARKVLLPFVTSTNQSQVQGATGRIMQQLIKQGRAVSSTLPELPAERPQIRPRLTSFIRGASNSGSRGKVVTITETIKDETEIMRPRPKSLNLSKFVEKIVKRTEAKKILVDDNKSTTVTSITSRKAAAITAANSLPTCTQVTCTQTSSMGTNNIKNINCVDNCVKSVVCKSTKSSKVTDADKKEDNIRQRPQSTPPKRHLSIKQREFSVSTPQLAPHVMQPTVSTSNRNQTKVIDYMFTTPNGQAVAATAATTTAAAAATASTANAAPRKYQMPTAQYEYQSNRLTVSLESLLRSALQIEKKY